MKTDIDHQVAKIENRIDCYSVEPLESRFEMIAVPGNSQCSSTCGSGKESED
jgi:hypothetical protein